MDERATGLILRTHPLSETSLVVHWLTPDLGRVATAAKGAHRPKSALRGKLDLFFLADFSFQRSRRSDLHNLREVSLKETHNALRQELGYLQQAAYCARLIEQATETETPLPTVFELMTGLLQSLPTHSPGPLTIFSFEMKLLHELGLQPDFENTKLTAGSRRILEQCLAADWQALNRLRLTSGQVLEISQFLHGFLIYHCGRIPSGRAAALESGERG